MKYAIRWVVALMLLASAVSYIREKALSETFSINAAASPWRVIKVEKGDGIRSLSTEIGYAPKDYAYGCLASDWPGGYVGPIRYAFTLGPGEHKRIRVLDNFVKGKRCKWMFSEAIFTVTTMESEQYFFSLPRSSVVPGRRYELQCRAQQSIRFCLTRDEAQRVSPGSGFFTDLEVVII